MQTILGAGGTIGKQLAKELKNYLDNIRLVSRNPDKVNESDELFPADLLNKEAVLKAVEGSEVVYLVAGLPYSTKAWKAMWPSVMKNVIEACKAHGSKLVFFDNVYMYDRDHLHHMTEDTPIKPSSKKGNIRTEVVNMLMDEVKSGNLTALIARSADFYGPGMDDNKSLLIETVFKNLANGKKADWMISSKHLHSFTYTADAAKATALLGNTKDAFNQVWHVPTASNPMTGAEMVQAVANEMGVEGKVRDVPRFMLNILGLFVSPVKEGIEMMYQFDRDYVFDSHKFEKQFNFKPTSYNEGIKQTIKANFSAGNRMKAK